MQPSLAIHRLNIFNPGRMTDAEIVAAYIVRRSQFDRIVADLAAESATSRAQHHLIVGQRGMGKTTLLLRLAAELRAEPLGQRFLPLLFSEEQYAVDRLSKFWVNCLDSLADALERMGGDAAAEKIEAQKIDATVRKLQAGLADRKRAEDDLAREALDAFLEAADRTQRRPVLLVDNIQLVFENIGDQQQHVLREVLQRPGAPVLVAASPAPPPESRDYGAAFYDQFKTYYLPPLDLREMRDLLASLAKSAGARRCCRARAAISRPDRRPAPTHGWQPADYGTAVSLYAEDFAPTVFGDLEQLLDRVTPLYKARFEELSQQMQVVAGAMANHWDPITARQLAEATGLAQNQVSPQLDRLKKLEWADEVEVFGTARAGYQIAERFFNIWFLMRNASRRQRRQIEFLTRFLEAFYEPADRQRLAISLSHERDLSPDRITFALSLCRTLDDGCIKAGLERKVHLDALRRQEADARRRLDEVLDLSALPPATLAFDELRRKLESLAPVDADVAPAEFAREVLGSIEFFCSGERERLVTKSRLTAEEVHRVRELMGVGQEVAEQRYGPEAVAWLSDRLANGQLRALQDIGDWNRAFIQSPSAGSQYVQILIGKIPPALKGTLAKKAIAANSGITCSKFRVYSNPMVDMGRNPGRRCTGLRRCGKCLPPRDRTQPDVVVSVVQSGQSPQESFGSL